MKLLAIVFCLGLASCQLSDADHFRDFKKGYNKTFASSAEELKRFQVFKANLQRARKLQKESPSAKYGVTKFSDLTEQEFRALYTGFKPSNETRVPKKASGGKKVTAPGYIDWVSKGAVTDVKDQGKCGSCWTFSATGNMEAQHYLATGDLVSLSEQMLVDCDRDSGNAGCDGGDPTNAFQWVVDRGAQGETTEQAKPYKAKQYPCDTTTDYPVGATLTSWEAVSTDENEMANTLVLKGPLSVGINAGTLNAYQSGVECPSKTACDPKGVDHAVLIVGWGYDSASKQEYWKVKNSWASDWGESGYWRVCKGKGACGINLYASVSSASSKTV